MLINSKAKEIKMELNTIILPVNISAGYARDF